MKRFLNFIKQSFHALKNILTTQEWVLTIVTFLLSGLIVSSIYWVPKLDDEENIFLSHGYNLKVSTSEQTKLRPFHTYYYVLYEKKYPQAQHDLVNTILEEEVPHLHKISDRNYRFYQNDQDPSQGLMVTIRDVNESYGSGQWLEINDHLYNILSIGKRITIETNSAFNFFVGKVSDYWNSLLDDINYPFEFTTMDPHFNEQERTALETLTSYIPKTTSEVNETLQLKEEDNKYYVKFNEFNNAPLGQLAITLGGIAKGYANDVISKRLIENRLTHGYISGGQSSNTALGSRSKNAVWDIPMSSPVKGVNYAYIINRSGYFNIATSGGYEGTKIIINDEIVWRHHIIDVSTGYPAHTQLHVNVMSNDVSATELDALSTALMNMTINDGLLLRQAYLAAGHELEIAWININDHNKLDIHYTNGFEQYLETNSENDYFLSDLLS